uniref:Uncharacterized protein n=1 Tax=Ciona savignyi TaxID=51511 RepID=H2YD82_CIOSA
MSSKQRIQTYLKQNKISELFEEMMGKLISDLPSKPADYLVNFLQTRYSISKKKVEVQQTHLKTTSKSISPSSAGNMWNESKPKPSKSPSKQNITEIDGKDQRQYSKPWQGNSKKHDMKVGLSQTLPTRTKSSLDQKSKSMDLTEARKSKVTSKKVETDNEEVDLRLAYSKPKIYGKFRDESGNEFAELQCNDKENKRSTTKPKSDVVSKKKRRQELSKILASQNKEKRTNSKDEIEDDNDDDAMELCEDFSDLQQEGVKNPPKSGVRLSSNSKRQKEEIELVLNMSRFFDSLGGAVSITNVDGVSPSNHNIQDGEDDFESASQVTGPRRPVWETPQSDVDTSVGTSNRRAKAAMFDLQSKLSKSGIASQTEKPQLAQQGALSVKSSRNGSVVGDKTINPPTPKPSSKEPSVVSAGRRSLVEERSNSRRSSRASKTAQ